MENQQNLILLRFFNFHFLFPSLQYLLQWYLLGLQVFYLLDSQIPLEQLIINLVLSTIQIKPKQ